MNARALLAVAVLAVSGCALRPRYGDFVTAKTQGAEVVVELVKPPDNTPLAGVKLEMGEGRSRFSAVTDDRGRARLPVDRRQLDDNPVIVISPPVGLTTWKLRQVFEDTAPAPGTPQ